MAKSYYKPRGHGTRNTTDYLTDDEVEFALAMEAWKDKNHCRFPKWSDVLKVIRALGYRKPKKPPSTS